MADALSVGARITLSRHDNLDIRTEQVPHFAYKTICKYLWYCGSSNLIPSVKEGYIHVLGNTTGSYVPRRTMACITVHKIEGFRLRMSLAGPTYDMVLPEGHAITTSVLKTDPGM